MKQCYSILCLLLFVSIAVKAQTVLQPGDAAIVSFNMDGNDEWSFVTFVDLAPGTSLIFTDNGFERNAASGANTWGNTEEVIQLTTTALISAGTIVSYSPANPAPYTIPNTFTHTSIASSSAVPPQLMNQMNASGDGIFILQGTWTNGTSGSHNATFSGSYVWGFNGKPWYTSAAPINSTSESRLPAQLACANTGFTHFDNFSYMASAVYAGSIGTLTSNIINFANWNRDDAITYPAPAGPFVITAGPTTATWTGLVNTDWFNCGNWDTYKVPNAVTNVLFPSNNVGNRDIVLAASTHAQCRNLTITGPTQRQIKGEGNASKVLSIFGNLDINSQDALDFSDGAAATADGTINIYGNWTNANETWFKDGNSTVNFVGTTDQTISCLVGGQEIYYNMVMNKPSGRIILSQNIAVGGDPSDPITDRNGILTLTNGLVETGIYRLYVSNRAATAIVGHSTAAYINGNLRREINGAGTNAYDFPVGTAAFYELATVTTSNPTGFTLLDAVFLTSYSASTLNVTETAVLYTTALDYGIWNIAPATGSMTGGSYNMTLAQRGYTNGGAPNYIVVKRNGVTPWINEGTAGVFSEVVGIITCTRTGLTSFSQFAIVLPTGPFPVLLSTFGGDWIDAGTAQLDWASLSEVNLDSYRLDRSANGTAFVPVVTMPAKGEAQGGADYRYQDIGLLPGTYIYRLHSLDLDGTERDLGQVLLSTSAKQDLSIKAYPNPANERMQLDIRPADQLVEFALTDITGKVLLQGRSSGAVLSAQYSDVFIHLPKGAYLLWINAGTTSYSVKVVKF